MSIQYINALYLANAIYFVILPMQGQKEEQELIPSGEYWEQIPQSGTQKHKTKVQNKNTKQNTKNTTHTMLLF